MNPEVLRELEEKFEILDRELHTTTREDLAKENVYWKEKCERMEEKIKELEMILSDK